MAIYSRSPKYVSITNASISYATLEVFIWQGDTIFNLPATPTYTFKKYKAGASNIISFEIAEIVKDYLTQPLNEAFGGETAWVKTVIKAFNISKVQQGATVTNLDIAFSAYTYFENDVIDDDKTLLIDQTQVYLLEGTSYRIPFRTNNNPIITQNLTGGGTTVNSFTSSTESLEQVEYVSTAGVNVDSIVVDDDNGTTTLNVTTVSECKFNPYKITFVNRYGVKQECIFFKKSVNKLNVKKETYKGNILKTNNTYNVDSHVNVDFNLTGNESIILNSGYLDQSQNEIFKQLLLSERVWLTNLVGTPQTLPVNIKTSDITFKTSVNDRLVEYTMEFENSYNVINNIR
jgi:hypothetical protein